MKVNKATMKVSYLFLTTFLTFLSVIKPHLGHFANEVHLKDKRKRRTQDPFPLRVY